ncbi:MAG: hypothetical protein WCS15_03910 [Prevotella sp.]
MFGSSNKDNITQEQLEEAFQPLLARLDKLETKAKKQAKQLAEVEAQLKKLMNNKGNSSSLSSSPSPVGEEELQIFSPQFPSPSGEELGERQLAMTFYLPAPTPDGQFLESSTTEQVGKSIYQLRTEDGANGQFIMLSSPDAIATAMISVSQFVKPACRIEGNSNRQPSSVFTLEEGVAQFEGSVWHVIRKARVVFE